MSVHKRKRGDTGRQFRSILEDENGPVLLLADDEVRFLMRQIDGDKVVDAEATITAAGVDQDSPLCGEVTYQPVDVDVDTVGVYRQEWELTRAGKPLTFPSPEWNEVIIYADLNPA